MLSATNAGESERTRRTTKLLVLAILVATSAIAAPAGDFQGVWQLDLSKSDFGQCHSVASILKVEVGHGRLRVIELTSDPSGDHILNREFAITERHRRTLTVQPDALDLSAPPEQWILFRRGSELVINRSCGESRQRIVFERSAEVRE